MHLAHTVHLAHIAYWSVSVLAHHGEPSTLKEEGGEVESGTLQITKAAAQEADV